MSKQSSAHATLSKSPGSTRSTASVLERQHTLGPHICIQRETTGPATHPAAPSLVREVVESPGKSLDAQTRSSLEPRLGHDFSQVRVHTDDRAAESARSVSANAYTTGNHVAFGTGQYTPGTLAGQRLIAHELTHVVQQASGPVASTNVADGLSVSDSEDAFERTAREIGRRIGSESNRGASVALDRSGLHAIGRHSGPIVLQRADPTSDQIASQTQSASDSAKAAQTSATAGVFSAVFGGLQAFEAIRSANFTGRQAEAAEDPPVPTPTTTGVAANDVDIPESKGISAKHLKEYTETETVDEETRYGEIKDEKGEDKAKGGKNPYTEIKTTHKEAETADQEERFHVLRVTQGATESADFYVNLLYNGIDIKGGTTEQGEFKGYKGGTNNANLSVNFRASKGGQMVVKEDSKAPKEGEAKPGEKDQDLAGTARLTFRGTNAPPRKTLSSGTGAGFARFFYGGGGPEVKQDYDKLLQNFNGAVRFTGKGTAMVDTPKDKKEVDKGGANKGPDGKSGPLVTITLGTPAGTSQGTPPPAAQAGGTQIKEGGGAATPPPAAGGANK